MSEWFIGKIERLDNEPLNEIRRLKQREAELEDAIKAALKISNLWCMHDNIGELAQVVYVENESELQALSEMYNKFKELVE